MCGRFVLGPQYELWPELFGVDPRELNLKPRYNVAPTQEIPTIRIDAGNRVVQMMSWGIVPFWIKKMSDQRMYINARAETVSDRMYKNAFTNRRCLIPASGLYEWMVRSDGSKQPMYIRLKSTEPFVFAGIWDRATPKIAPERGEITSCSIITTVPNELMEPIHNRMPVILAPDLCDDWLNPENHDLGELKEFLLPFDPGLMEAYPVSAKVGNVMNDGPKLIERVE